MKEKFIQRSNLARSWTKEKINQLQVIQSWLLEEADKNNLAIIATDGPENNSQKIIDHFNTSKNEKTNPRK